MERAEQLQVATGKSESERVGGCVVRRDWKEVGGCVGKRLSKRRCSGRKECRMKWVREYCRHAQPALTGPGSACSTWLQQPAAWQRWDI